MSTFEESSTYESTLNTITVSNDTDICFSLWSSSCMSSNASKYNAGFMFGVFLYVCLLVISVCSGFEMCRCNYTDCSSCRCTFIITLRSSDCRRRNVIDVDRVPTIASTISNVQKFCLSTQATVSQLVFFFWERKKNVRMESVGLSDVDKNDAIFAYLLETVSPLLHFKISL